MNFIKKIIKKFIKSHSHSSLIVIIFKSILKISERIRNNFQFRRDIGNETYLSDKEFFKKISVKKFNFNNTDYSNIYNCLLDTNELKKIVPQISLESKANIVSRANKICVHYFNLLGSGEVQVRSNMAAAGFEGIKIFLQTPEDEIKKIKSDIKDKIINYCIDLKNYDYEPIDWQIDFKSGYRWDKNKWYKKIGYNNPLGADIKVPWELSRFNHMILLGEAYVLTGNENYTREFIFEITDWIDNNPPRFGVNWLCAMDAAIRACNMILAFSFFENSALISNEFRKVFIKNILTHGIHIYSNLENNYYVNNNHYLSNIAGLLYCGQFLKNTKIGQKWLRFAILQLKKEMQNQVYDDGVDFEGSTCYHKLVLEIFFYSTYFSIKGPAANNGSLDFKNYAIEIFGCEYVNKLFKMFNFLKIISNKEGVIPQIGDNDSGRLHKFSEGNELNVNYLLTLGAIFYNQEDLKVNEFGFNEEVLWLYGINGFKKWEELKSKKHAEIEGYSFHNSGIYSIKENNVNMLISASANGQKGIGGHSHNDKLSFNLSVGTEDLFVDSGTYIYTPMPKLRNQFRSTYAHNTAIIDNEEQSRLDETDLFFLYNDAKVKINNWVVDEDYYFFDGEHYGYLRLKEPVVHQRKIFFERKKTFWIVNDIFRGKGHHLFEFNFVLNSGLILSKDDRSLTVNISSLKLEKFKIFPLKDDTIDISIDEGYISKSYGEKKLTKIIRYSALESSNKEFIFIITYNKSDDFSISEDEVNFLLNKCKEKY